MYEVFHTSSRWKKTNYQNLMYGAISYVIKPGSGKRMPKANTLNECKCKYSGNDEVPENVKTVLSHCPES